MKYHFYNLIFTKRCEILKKEGGGKRQEGRKEKEEN